MQGEREDDTEASCIYCGWALDDSDGQSGDSQVRVPIPCTHEGFVHARYMLHREDRIARGHADPRPCVACQSAWPGGIRPPHPPELARGLPMTELGGRWAAVRRALQSAALLQPDALGTEPARHVMTGVHNTFELALRMSSTSSSVLRSLFSDAIDLPQEACLGFLRTREWEEAASHYRTLFVAYGIRPQDILLRLPNRKLYIGSHVQEYLAGLDAELGERLIRWTRDVQAALELSDALPPFPTVVATTPEGTDPALENDRLARGLFGQGDAAALDSRESRQTTGARDARLGVLRTYCGRVLQDSSGHSRVDHLWSILTCAHGEFVHAGGMLDRAERLACGHTDQRPCVVCRSDGQQEPGLPIQ